MVVVDHSNSSTQLKMLLSVDLRHFTNLQAKCLVVKMGQDQHGITELDVKCRGSAMAASNKRAGWRRRGRHVWGLRSHVHLWLRLFEPRGVFHKVGLVFKPGLFQWIMFHKGGLNKSDLSYHGNVSLQTSPVLVRLFFRLSFMMFCQRFLPEGSSLLLHCEHESVCTTRKM